MNTFQTCKNTSDAVPLYLPQQLYLKPVVKLNISIQLPNVKKMSKAISHWEIMEQLRLAIKPDEFSLLKVSKTTVEFVRFEAELENKTRLDKVLSKLDNNVIRLKDFSELLRLKAAEAKSDFPTRHKWDAFFQEAKDMDEMKPGQRPDTVHISNLPIKWFVPYHLSDEEDVTPSEKMFFRIFEKYGTIRYVDIPICDPYRKKMKDSISGIKVHNFDDKEFFEGYVQFKDYMGFTKTMDALRGMKLLRKDDDGAQYVSIKVDFDRTKHLSDAFVRRREIVRDRLVKKQREKEEKEKDELDDKKKKEHSERQKQIDLKHEREQRRREREERRKAKIINKLKINGCDEINDKIAKEEKKLLKVQRRLEAIRLVEELFRRIKEKKNEFNVRNKTKSSGNDDELRRFKNVSELEVLTQREKLHKAIEGRVVLKSILSDSKQPKNRRSSSSDSSKSVDESEQQKLGKHVAHPASTISSDAMYDPSWYYPYALSTQPPMYAAPQMRGNYYMYPSRGRGRLPIAGPSRGRGFGHPRNYKSHYRGNYRGPLNHQYGPDVEKEYFKYFSKFLSEHDDRRPHGRSARSRSRRRSSSRYSRSRSGSRRRSYSRSFSRSRSRHRSRSRSRSRSRGRSRSRSRDRQARSRSHSSRSRSPRRRRSKTASKRSTKRSKTRTPTPRKRSRSKSREKSRSKSVDSSKFVSPRHMRRQRSKSWSMPKSTDKPTRSWSKSPEPETSEKK